MGVLPEDAICAACEPGCAPLNCSELQDVEEAAVGGSGYGVGVVGFVSTEWSHKNELTAGKEWGRSTHRRGGRQAWQ